MSESQTNAICRVLLQSLRMERLWGAQGPTDEARELLEEDGGHLSSGERTLLLCCWEIADFATRLPVSGLFLLDGERLALVGSALTALGRGPKAVDDWLRAHGQLPAARAASDAGVVEYVCHHCEAVIIAAAAYNDDDANRIDAAVKAHVCPARVA